MINIKLDKNTWWVKLLILNSNTWNHFTGCKKMRSGPFKNNDTNKSDMYEQDLELYNPNGLICH